MSTPAISAISAIPENSLFLKAISYAPILGIIPQLFAELSIGNRISTEEEHLRMIELIEIKSDYKIAGIMRSLIECAMIVACVALGFFGTIMLILACVLLGAACLNYAFLYYNRFIIFNIRQEESTEPGIMTC